MISSCGILPTYGLTEMTNTSLMTDQTASTTDPGALHQPQKQLKMAKVESVTTETMRRQKSNAAARTQTDTHTIQRMDAANAAAQKPLMLRSNNAVTTLCKHLEHVNRTVYYYSTDMTCTISDS